MTLVELLVVIVLISTLVTTAIPIISPGGDSRKLREASRNVNAYLQGAQARAVQTGRPFGVALRRLSEDTGRAEDNAVCVRLEYVEVPPAYSGVDGSSLARVLIWDDTATGVRRYGLQFVRYGNLTPSSADRLPTGFDVDLTPDAFFRDGDLIRIGGRSFVFRGFTQTEMRGSRLTRFGARGVSALTYYLVNAPGSVAADYFNTAEQRVDGSVILLDPVDDVPPDLRLVHDWDGMEIASPEAISYDSGVSYLATAPAPYKVYRQPVPASGEPLELPAGAAVDLQASVLGEGVRLYDPVVDYDQDNSNDAGDFDPRQTPVMVLFSPEGNVHRVHGLVNADRTLAEPKRVSGFLAMCVGRRELIPAKPQGGTAVADYQEPINLGAPAYAALSEVEQRELTDQYNWLNLDSRWVVVGGATGSVATVANTAVYPSDADRNADDAVTMSEQLAAALESAPRRSTVGGR